MIDIRVCAALAAFAAMAVLPSCARAEKPIDPDNPFAALLALKGKV